MIQNQHRTLLSDAALSTDTQHFSSTAILVTSGAAIAALVALAYAKRRQNDPDSLPKKFTNENITAKFTAAIPTITRILNLEWATAQQTETFTRNIATFHQNITEGRFDNGTVRRAVDSALACILGREAAAGEARLTLTSLLEENRRIEVDLSGLKI